MSAPGQPPFVMRDPGWHMADWWHGAARLVLLLALLMGVAAGVAALRAAPASQDVLVADLHAHRVTQIFYDSGTEEVRWQYGLWRWRRATLVDSTVASNQSGDTAYVWLEQEIGKSGSSVPVEQGSGANGPDDWLSPTRPGTGPVHVITTAAWLTTFLIMVGRSRHRYANRWAWFWLFILGQVTMVLYLIMEPQPLWRPRSWAARVDRRPISGGAGFGCAILLSIAVSLLGYLIART